MTHQSHAFIGIGSIRCSKCGCFQTGLDAKIRCPETIQPVPDKPNEIDWFSINAGKA